MRCSWERYGRNDEGDANGACGDGLRARMASAGSAWGEDEEMARSGNGEGCGHVRRAGPTGRQIEQRYEGQLSGGREPSVGW